MFSRTPTKVYGPKSLGSSRRFCIKPFAYSASSIPIFSVTEREECQPEGVQLSNLISEHSIYVENDSSLSSRSCPKCTRRIVAACKTLSEIKEGTQAGLNSLPRNPSVKKTSKELSKLSFISGIFGNKQRPCRTASSKEIELELDRPQSPADHVSSISQLERNVHVVNVGRARAMDW